MHLVCNAGELAAALKVIRPAVSTRGRIPILSHVVIDARDGRLALSSTNLEISLRTSISAEVEKPGRTTTTEAKLSGWISLQPSKSDVTLKADGKSLALTCGRDRAGLGVADPDDAPPTPTPDGPSFILASDTLIRGIDLTLPSVAGEAERPVLRGLCWAFNEARLTLAGADGHRLGIAIVDLVEPVEEPLTLIVPRASVQALRGLLAGPPTVVIQTNGRRSLVSFTAGETTLCSSLLDGIFPDFQRVVPTEFKTSVVVQSSALEQQVRAAQLTGKDTPVRFKSDPEAGTLTVWARDPDVEHEGVIDGGVMGEDLEVALSSEFVVDALQALDAEQILFRFNGPTMPALLTIPDDDSGALQLLMSMHVGAEHRMARTEAA